MSEMTTRETAILSSDDVHRGLRTVRYLTDAESDWARLQLLAHDEALRAERDAALRAVAALVDTILDEAGEGFNTFAGTRAILAKLSEAHPLIDTALRRLANEPNTHPAIAAAREASRGS